MSNRGNENVHYTTVNFVLVPRANKIKCKYFEKSNYHF